MTRSRAFVFPMFVGMPHLAKEVIDDGYDTTAPCMMSAKPDQANYHQNKDLTSRISFRIQNFIDRRFKLL